MSNSPSAPRATPQTPAPAAAQPAAESTVITERRKFPRDLPKPEAVELNSDSAWQAFQASMGKAQEETAAKQGDSAAT